MNSNTLKIIAMAAMTIDHFTSVIFPGYPKYPGIIFLHVIGRLAAPVFWFFIAEGYYYTRSVKKYIERLLLFALVSHFAYNFAFGIPFIPFQTTIFNQTSHFWALALGLTALAIRKSDHPKLTPLKKTLIVFILCVLAFCADWSSIAVLVIVSHGMNRGNFKKQMLMMLVYVAMYVAVYFFFIDKAYGILQMATACSIPLLAMYNGERGKMTGLKRFFYVYYPLHLIICGIIRVILHGNVGVMIGG